MKIRTGETSSTYKYLSSNPSCPLGEVRPVLVLPNAACIYLHPVLYLPCSFLLVSFHCSHSYVFPFKNWIHKRIKCLSFKMSLYTLLLLHWGTRTLQTWHLTAAHLIQLSSFLPGSHWHHSILLSKIFCPGLGQPTSPSSLCMQSSWGIQLCIKTWLPAIEEIMDQITKNVGT